MDQHVMLRSQKLSISTDWSVYVDVRLSWGYEVPQHGILGTIQKMLELTRNELFFTI
jgi:hypothetical protein